MQQPTGQKKGVWFWVGVVLLSVSALWWLLIVLILVSEPEDVAVTVVVSLILTAVPMGVGIYCMMHGRKPRGVEVQQSPEPTYVSQPVAKPAQSVKLGREAYADFDKSVAENLTESARQGRKKPEWKYLPIVLGIIPASIAVIGSVFSLPINPSWLRSVLLFAVLAAWIVVLFSNKRWLLILFLTACGILVIYTIIGVILGNIDWVWPGGYKGP